MGTWASGILDNDNSADVHGEYLRLFDEGKSAAAIVKQLREEHLDPDDPQDRSEFWPALALAQWECGELAPATLNALKKVIARGDGLDAWEAEGAAAAAAERRRALDELLDQLAKPNPSPKSRGRKARPRPPFKPGTCVAFRFPDGRWGAAVAMKSSSGWGAFCFMKVLNYRSADPPTIDVFEQRDWLYARLPNGKRSDDPFVMPLRGSTVEQDPGDYRVVGVMKLRPEDDYNFYTMHQGNLGMIVADFF
jgi:hypothetical protein